MPDVIGVGLLFGIFILGVGVGLFGAHMVYIKDFHSNISVILFFNAIFLLLILIALAVVKFGIFNF